MEVSPPIFQCKGKHWNNPNSPAETLSIAMRVAKIVFPVLNTEVQQPPVWSQAYRNSSQLSYGIYPTCSSFTLRKSGAILALEYNPRIAYNGFFENSANNLRHIVKHTCRRRPVSALLRFGAYDGPTSVVASNGVPLREYTNSALSWDMLKSDVQNKRPIVPSLTVKPLFNGWMSLVSVLLPVIRSTSFYSDTQEIAKYNPTYVGAQSSLYGYVIILPIAMIYQSHQMQLGAASKRRTVVCIWISYEYRNDTGGSMLLVSPVVMRTVLYSPPTSKPETPKTIVVLSLRRQITPLHDTTQCLPNRCCECRRPSVRNRKVMSRLITVSCVAEMNYRFGEITGTSTSSTKLQFHDRDKHNSGQTGIKLTTRMHEHKFASRRRDPIPFDSAYEDRDRAKIREQVSNQAVHSSYLYSATVPPSAFSGGKDTVLSANQYVSSVLFWEGLATKLNDIKVILLISNPSGILGVPRFGHFTDNSHQKNKRRKFVNACLAGWQTHYAGRGKPYCTSCKVDPNQLVSVWLVKPVNMILLISDYEFSFGFALFLAQQHVLSLVSSQNIRELHWPPNNHIGEECEDIQKDAFRRAVNLEPNRTDGKVERFCTEHCIYWESQENAQCFCIIRERYCDFSAQSIILDLSKQCRMGRFSRQGEWQLRTSKTGGDCEVSNRMRIIDPNWDEIITAVLDTTRSACFSSECIKRKRWISGKLLGLVQHASSFWAQSVLRPGDHFEDRSSFDSVRERWIYKFHEMR
ncbi:hypothetical protein CLF_109689 [Clonorchis sinensis]|uniref:Uncharacterized protein n=1 Tax=Clonorchis sinensis TaxID=79923 RepID=G7YSW0_CLOSI|nr:hypothetical protein CLF_109689 [Clonorchis sinensis]